MLTDWNQTENCDANGLDEAWNAVERADLPLFGPFGAWHQEGY